MLAKMVATAITKPKSSPVFSNPTYFGMEYEDVVFKAKDGVNLSGWLIKGNTDKVIIFSHFGLYSSRSGFVPSGKLLEAHKTEISYLNTFKHLVNAGYTVLAYDLRNHGNSDRGTCPWFTGGVEEYKDVIAAVDFISNHPVYKDSNIGLLSFCNGCNSTTYAYGAKGGLANYKNIKALFALQPITLSALLKGMKIPDRIIRKASKISISRGGASLYTSFIPYVKNINVPTILVQGKGDPLFSKPLIKDYFNELRVEKEMYWLDGPRDRFSYYDWFNKYPEKMIEFFNKYV